MKNYLYIILGLVGTGFLASCGESEGCGCGDFGLLSSTEQQTIFFPGGFTPNGDGKNDYARLDYHGTEPADVKMLIQYDNVTIDSSFGASASWDGVTEGLNIGDRAEFRVYLYYTNADGEDVLETFRLMRIVPSNCGVSQQDKEIRFNDMYVHGSTELGQTTETFCP